MSCTGVLTKESCKVLKLLIGKSENLKWVSIIDCSNSNYMIIDKYRNVAYDFKEALEIIYKETNFRHNKYDLTTEDSIELINLFEEYDVNGIIETYKYKVKKLLDEYEFSYSDEDIELYDYDQISIEFYSEKSYIKGVGSCGNKFIVTGFLDDDNQNICLDLDTVGSNERYYYKNVYMFMTELFPILEKIKEMYNKSKCIY